MANFLLAIEIFSIGFQLIAAILAMNLIQITGRRTAWILISISLLLMVIRRVFSLSLDISKPYSNSDFLFELVGLIVSGLMLCGVIYIRNYFQSIYRTEEALKYSKRQNQTILDTAGEGIIGLDEKGCISFINPTAARLLGTDAKTAVGEVMHDKYHHTRADGAIYPVESCMICNTIIEGETRLISDELFWRANGASFPVEYVSTSSWENGKRLGTVVVFKDITQRKRNEKEIQETRDYLDRILNGLFEGVMVLDLERRIVDINKGFSDQYGQPRQEIIGKTCHEVTHACPRPCDEMGNICPFLDVIKNKSRVNAEHIHKDGYGNDRIVEINCFPLLDSNGQIEQIVELTHDITARKHYEEALQKSESRYRSITELMSDYSFSAIIDPNQNISPNWIAGAFEKITGFSQDDFFSQGGWSKIVHPDDMQKDLNDLSDLLKNRSIGRELRIIAKSGEVRWILNSVKPIWDNQKGRVVELIGAVRDITERKRSEEHIAVLATMVDAAPASITVHDFEGNFLYANRKTLDIHQYEEQEFRVINLHELDVPESEALIEPRMKQIALTGEASFEVTHFRKDRSIVPLAVDIKVIDWGGKPAVLSIATDITQRKQAEKTLEEQGLWLRESQRVAHIGTYQLDIPKGEWQCTPVVDEIFGISNLYHKDIAGWINIVHPEQRQEIYDYFQNAVMADKKRFDKEYRILRQSDGQIRWVHGLGELTFDINGNPLTMIGTLQDITDRKRTENEIHRRAKELEILASISTSMRKAENRVEIYPILLDRVADLLNAQASAVALKDDKTGETIIELGYGAWSDWSGMRMAPGQGVTGQVISTAATYLTEDAVNDLIASFPEKYHDVRCAACIPLRVRDETIGTLWMGSENPIDPESLRLLQAIADMAANAIQRQVLYENLQNQFVAVKETQSRLIQSEKMAAIGQLVSGVAHELNNPLTSVVLYAQLAQREKQEKNVRNNLGKVISEALRAGKIVQGLLDFARQRPMIRERIQINNIIKSSIDLLSYELRAHDIKVELQLSPELPLLQGDPHLLTQVFVNLIQNAWQALGSIQSSGRLQILTEIGLSTYPSQETDRGNVVRITINDDGPGISSENIPRIFDPFFTTKPEGEGTGLGLSICHGIITEHNGKIWAESNHGQGSTFFVELPLEESKQVSSVRKRKTLTTQTFPTKGSRFLILDDEPNIQDVLARILKKQGYVVDTVGNGEEGLSILSHTSYDFILCDIRMPNFNGLEFYKKIKAKDKSLAKRIIFITGDTANRVTYSFIEKHGIPCLTKPFELGDLLQTVGAMNDPSLANPIGKIKST